jgi:hypothetical protein
VDTLLVNQVGFRTVFDTVWFDTTFRRSDSAYWDNHPNPCRWQIRKISKYLDSIAALNECIDTYMAYLNIDGTLSGMVSVVAVDSLLWRSPTLRGSTRKAYFVEDSTWQQFKQARGL